MTDPNYVSAHKHSTRNREEIEESDLCGCFYCLSLFSPLEITEWIDEEDTAMCPSCGVDSVIGSKSGYPMTAEFLKKMKDRWF